MKIILWSSTKILALAQYVNQCLVWHKKFGPAQNVLGPVKGQGVNLSSLYQFNIAFQKTKNFPLNLLIFCKKKPIEFLSSSLKLHNRYCILHQVGNDLLEAASSLMEAQP